MTLIEFLPEFVELLQLRFPKARVLCMDAARLRERRLFESASVGAVVSGLPLLSMSSKRVFYILKGAFSYMEPMGAFYQFTYGPRCPVPRSFLDRLGLKSTRLGRVLLNMPPATVYRITRRRPARLVLA
jgi:phospholipid N-methyltransferase